jgi:hypothetical protein
MLLLHGRRLTRRAHAFVAVLLHRLEQPVSCCVGGQLDLYQRLVHQRREQLQDPLRLRAVSRGDRLYGREGKPTPEHRHAAQQLLLRPRQQIPAPIERCPQGLVAG